MTARECESPSALGRVLYRPRRRPCACRHVYVWRAMEGEGRASSGLHCAAREASMAQADRRGSTAALALTRRGKRGDEDEKGREESRVVDEVGPRLFRAKTVRPGAPGRPQRAGFGLGLPALFSAQAGEN